MKKNISNKLGKINNKQLDYNFKKKIGTTNYKINFGKNIKNNIVIVCSIATLAITLMSFGMQNQLEGKEYKLQSNLFDSQIGNIESYNDIQNKINNLRNKIKGEYQYYYDINKRFINVYINDNNLCKFSDYNGNEFYLSTKLDNDLKNLKNVKLINFNKLKTLILEDIKKNNINYGDIEKFFNNFKIGINNKNEEIIFLDFYQDLNKKEEKIVDIIYKVFGDNFYINGINKKGEQKTII